MAIILLVEDNPAYRVALQVSLHHAGHTVWVARGVREAQTMLAARHESVAVAVLDWYLPDGQAEAILRGLRETRPDTSAVVMTAGPQWREVRGRALAAGALAVLSKADGFEPVLALVAQLISPGQITGYPLRLDGVMLIRLTPPGGTVELSPLQSRIVQVFLARPTHQPAISAQELDSMVAAYEPGRQSSVVIAQRIHRLRPRLAPLGVYIRAERWRGYWLEVE